MRQCGDREESTERRQTQHRGAFSPGETLGLERERDLVLSGPDYAAHEIAVGAPNAMGEVFVELVRVGSANVVGLKDRHGSQSVLAKVNLNAEMLRTYP